MIADQAGKAIRKKRYLSIVLRKFLRYHQEHMHTIGISLHFQDTYDQEVARGLIEWAKEKPQWRLVGPIGGMMDLRPHARQELNALVVRIESEADIRKYEQLTIPVIAIAGP